MNIILKLIQKFLTPEYISKIIAHLISIILKKASKNGGEYWERAKITIRKIKIWVDLFEEVYEDDKMTQEEELKIAEAIKNQSKIETLLNIQNK